MTEREMTSRELHAAAIAAGVTEDELQDDPAHGLLIARSGFRKIVAGVAEKRCSPKLLALVNRVVDHVPTSNEKP